MKAIWNGETIAESEDTIIVEGNHYFPMSALNQAWLKPSSHTTVCGWKGTANYYHLEVNGKVNENAAWFYGEPKPGAAEVKDRVAFWRGVEVV